MYIPRARLWRRALLLCVALLLAGLVVAGVADAADLGGEWHLDDLVNGQTTPDSSGNGNDLTLTSGSAAVTTGRFGNAFNFGNHGQLSPGPAPSLEPQQLTVMAWVRGNASPGASYLVSKGSDVPPTLSNVCLASYALFSDVNGKLSFYVWAGGVAQFAPSPTETQDLWDGNWHAVAGTYDGSTVRFYVDGSEVGNGTPSNTPIGYGLGDNTFRI